MIRYDLNDLDPAVRAEVIKEVNRRGILNTYVDHVLSVPDEFEEAVDALVDIEDQRGEFQREFEEELRQVHAGIRSASCDTCGTSPAAQLVLRRQVGMIVIAKTETFEAVLCRSCGENLRKWIQKQNAIKGWTGVKSALMNPVVLGTNERNYARFLESLEKHI